MDDNGNILARRYSKSGIFVKGAGNSPNEETAIGSEIMKSPNQNLELEKVMKVSCVVTFKLKYCCNTVFNFRFLT